MNEPDLEITFRLDRQTRRVERGQPNSGTVPVPRVSRAARALALAIYFEDLIDRGEAQDYADIARLACLSRERVSQVSKLRFLAPEIQTEVLTGRLDLAETTLRRIASSLDWRQQCASWAVQTDRRDVEAQGAVVCLRSPRVGGLSEAG